MVLGHGAARYRVDMKWAKADPALAPVINSHAMAEGRDGRIYLVTDHPKNDFLVFEKDGRLVRTISAGLGGGHGLEIFEAGGQEYLLHIDCGWHFAAEGWNPSPGEGRVTREGDSRTFRVEEAPDVVVKTALKAANLIGNGLYGVDLKQTAKGVVVIEINDNPNIDHGIEDAVLKESLYRTLLEDMVWRLDRRRGK